MMNRKRLPEFPLFLLAAGLLLAACSKMDAGYKEFIKQGEIVYTGKADSVTAFAGKNRVKLTWLLLSDPKITHCKLFWNNGSDSAEIPVQRSGGIDTVTTIQDNIPEGIYTFDVYTYDDAGHSSVKTDVIGTSYGEAYQNSLFNRPLKSVSFSGGNAVMDWYGASSQSVGAEVLYTDTLGVMHTVRVAPDSTQTHLAAFPQGDSLHYRTLYLPEATAIDTFYTGYEARQVQ